MKTRSMAWQLVLAGLAWAGCLCGAAWGDVWGDWTYEVDAGAATLTGWAGTGPTVTIPASVGDGTGVPVTGLGDELFAGRTDVTEIRVEAALTSVGTDVFAGCSNLTRAVIDAATVPSGMMNGFTTLEELVLEEGVERIDSAFIGCTGLGSVVIPDSVTYLSGGAFYNCTGITNLVIGDGLTNLCGVLGSCRNLERLVIGGGVKMLGCGMFGGLTNLHELVFSEGLEVIYQGTLSSAGISELRFPDSLQRIEGGSLGSLANLTNIVWGAGIREITGGVFGHCIALTDLTIPASVTNLSSGVFYDCVGLTNLVVNANIETYSGVFGGCTNLEKVVLGDGVGAVGDNVFAGFGKLTVVELGANVASIGEGAFSNCTALVRLTLPESVESVGENAFYGCTGLLELEVPGSWYGTDKLVGTGVPEGCYVAYRGMLAVATGTLPDATAGVDWEETLEARNGTPPYAWSGTHGIYKEESTVNTFAATGTPKGWTGDDECWEQALPFAFPFCGQTYDRCWVSDNGTICFSGSYSSYSFYESEFLARPMVAAMWADLGGSSMDIHVESGDEAVTVRWATAYYWNSGEANFSATLHADGRIVLKYGAGNANGGVVGISAGDGATAVWAAKNQAGNLGNAEDSVFTPGKPMPGWLELTQDGVLQGTPAGLGDHRFTVFVTDAAGGRAQRDLSLRVIPMKETVEGTDWLYLVEGGEAAVVGAEPAAGDLAVPGTLGGHPVTSVGEGAFAGCTNLTGMAIPGSVGQIGADAFSGCTGLAEVTLSEGVSNIGAGAFAGCSALESLEIPDSMESIGGEAFGGCTSLMAVDVPASWYGGYGTGLAEETGLPEGCAISYRGMAPLAITTPELPVAHEGVDYEVTLTASGGKPPYTWYRIGGVYWWNVSADGVLSGLPNRVAEYRAEAHVEDAGGVSVEAGWTLTVEAAPQEPVGGRTWKYALVNGGARVLGVEPASGDAEMPATLGGAPVTSIVAGAFRGCTNLTGMALPGSVTEIGAEAFWGCSALTALEIPGSVERIGLNAFRNCTGLTAVTVPGSVGEIAGATFAGCTGLVHVTIGGGVTGIGGAAFQGCYALETVEIPGSVTAIGAEAFRWCYALATLVIPDSVESIGENAFDRSGLATLEVPGAFYGNLGNAGVPEGCAVTYRGVAPLSVATTGLEPGIVNVKYEATLEAAGGKPPYTWGVLGASDAYTETSAACTFETTGTAKGWQGDDSCWDLALPFAFPYFGNTYARVKVNSNGALSFGSSSFTSTSYDASLCRSTPVIAVLWRDLRTDNGGNVYVESGNDWVKIRWQGTYYSGGAAASFSATLHADGRIVLSYGSGNASGGIIGLSAGDGSEMAFSANSNGGSMNNSDDIVFTPPVTFPRWLELTEGGELRGVPDGEGEHSFTVEATDATGVSAQKELTLRVMEVAEETENIGGTTWRYVVAGGKSVVTGAEPVEGALSIPGTLGGHPVKEVAPSAFAGCMALTEMTIPDSVEALGNGAFADCTGLTNVVLGAGVEDFVPGVFAGCENLERLEIGPNVSLTQAVGIVPEGATVAARAGRYTGTGAAVLTSNGKSVRVAGAGAETTVIDGDGARRCASLGWGTDTVLEGFTLANGAGGYEEQSVVYGGTLKGCVVTNGLSGGSVVYGSRLEDCVVAGNSAESSDGVVYGSTLVRCRLEGNASERGSTATSCNLDNCLVAGNDGQGVRYGTATHCTIAGNRGTGTHDTTLQNSIVWGNGAENSYGSYDEASCREGGLAWNGNIAMDPKFADAAAGDYGLAWDSPCRDAGIAAYAGPEAVDLAGNARTAGGAPDMGAFEAEPAERWVVRAETEWSGRVEPEWAVATNGMTVTFTAIEDERPFLGWKTDGEAAGTAPTLAWTAPAGGGEATVTALFETRTFRVDAAYGNDENDGAETTPMLTIQAAIDRALPGDTVLVGRGRYGPIVTHNKRIHILGLEGAGRTTIDAATSAQRCATLAEPQSEYYSGRQTNSVLEGFTLTGGDPYYGWENNDPNRGGGAFGGTLVDCTVKRNLKGGQCYGNAFRCRFIGNTGSDGGGMLGGNVAEECVFEGNRASNSGGGAYNVKNLRLCTVRSNEAVYGGGLAYCENTEGCSVEGNVATGSGGGAYYCTFMAGSRIEGNRADCADGDAYGGGIYGYGATASNCVVAGNTAVGVGAYGGGAYGADLVDCEISENAAQGRPSSSDWNTAHGGGMAYGTAKNCTIRGNRATVTGNYDANGGGTSSSDLTDCRITGNTAEGARFAYGGGGNYGSALRCAFSGNRAVALLKDGASYGGAASLMTLAECTVDNNTAGFGGGLDRGTASKCTITRNHATRQGGGAYETELANCIVAGNRAPVGGGYHNRYSEGLGWHNTFTLNESDMRGNPVPEWGAKNTLVWGETVGGQLTETGVPCPMADPWNGDYRLVAGSAAIDAGSATEVETDLAGNPRTQGASPDLGALEAEAGAGVETAWRRLTVATEGSGRTDIAAATVAAGESTTVTALGEGRPFLGWKTGGEIVSTNRTFTWDGTAGDGMLTAVFGTGEIWVDAARGDDANDGSEAAPMETLQAAVRLACDGDRVRVKPGTYRPFTVMGKTIEIASEAGAARTIIDAQAQGRRCATMDAGVTLRGFTLIHGNATSEAVEYNAAAACLGGRLEDCVVENCGWRKNGLGWNGDVNIFRNTELVRCIVRGCRARDLYEHVGMGILTNQNTLVTGNTVDTIWKDSAAGHTVNLNMTIAGNTAKTWAISGGDWWNSIVWDNGATGVSMHGGGWNCIEGAEPQGETEDGGPVWTDDPVFAGAYHGDYRLADVSPYFDAGNAERAGEGATDISGKARIEGTGVELGCHEGTVPTCELEFALGERLVQVDNRPLTGRIRQGDTATPPEVMAVSGWRFDGWTPSLEGVQENTVFTGKTSEAASDWQAIVHRGEVAEDTMWGAGTVHVVAGTVTVAAGASLTIEEGAVVKFAPGAKLVREDGGLVISMGAVFTHLNDDGVGGDTLGDGAARVPAGNDYEVQVDVEGEGTEYRYGTVAAEAGSEASGETVWGPGEVHVITDDFTVGRWKTLRLQAGCIVKIADTKNLTVEENGMLIAEGTASRPVIITSLHDDEHGGDTNGDGDMTWPEPGDWSSLVVDRGTARLNHTHILYGSHNPIKGAINMPRGGGKLVFDGGEIAHCLYDAVGVEPYNQFLVQNAVIRDSLVAFRHGGGAGARTIVANCVVYDCGRITQTWEGAYIFKNCVFADIEEIWEAFSFPRQQYRNCVFWNEGGSVLATTEANTPNPQDALDVCGKDGNIWGDPKFMEAENGDFHVREGSVCIDAGDGTAAPETDRYGNGRVALSGAAASGVADIGVHEFGGRYSGGDDVDVVVAEAKVLDGASGAVASGTQLTLSWRLENQGASAYAGTWTDRLKLVNADGQEAALGEAVNAGRIEPWTSKLYSGTFTVPLLTDGDWAIGVDANIDRGVLEGANAENNGFVSTNTMVVENPTVDVDGGTVELGVGEEKLVRLVGGFASGDALRIWLAGGEGPLTAWGANGALPTEERHWTCAALARGGAMVSVGSLWEAGQSYVRLKNGGETAVVAHFEFEGGASMVATGLERRDVTAGPTVGVVLEGVGLAGTAALELMDGDTVVAAGAGLVASAGRVSAVFDLSALKTDAEFEVRATDGTGDSTTSPVTLRVAVEPAAEGKLEFWLNLPEMVRDGRVNKGQVYYRNVGDADMEAPIFKVFDSLGKATVATAQDGAFAKDGNLLTGRGSGTPWSVLKAGDEGTVDFWFVAIDQYWLQVRWVKGGGGALTTEWLEKMAAEEKRQLAAEEAAAAAAEEWEATGAQVVAEYNAAHALAPAEPTLGSASGVLTVAGSGVPVAGATVRLEAAGNAFAEGETAEDGTFVLANVWPLGTYALAVEGWQIVSGAVVAVTGDVAGVEATVRRLTHVTGRLTAGDEGIAGVQVRATDSEFGRAECKSGEDGAFDLGWLADGTWMVRSGGSGEYVGAISEVVIDGQVELEVELAMTEGVAWEGHVVDAESGEGVEDIEIAVCDEVGHALQCATSGGDGAFSFTGVPKGTLRVASLSPEWQVGNGIEEFTPGYAGFGLVTGNVEVAKAALLRAFPKRGAAPLAVRFDLTRAGEMKEAVAWAWDFDGDGMADSDEESPVWEFTEPGTHAVSVELTLADGSIATGRVENAVTVRERLATVYQDDVVVLLEGDAAESTDWAFAGWNEETGVLRVRQVAGTPAIAMAAGVKFIFAIDGEVQYKMKAATEVAGPDGEGTWTVATENAAGLTAIYKQLDWSFNTVEAGGGGAGPASRRGGRRDGTGPEFSTGISDSYEETFGDENRQVTIKGNYYGDIYGNCQVIDGVQSTDASYSMTQKGSCTVTGKGGASGELGLHQKVFEKQFPNGITVTGVTEGHATGNAFGTGEGKAEWEMTETVDQDGLHTDYRNNASLDKMVLKENVGIGIGFTLGAKLPTQYGILEITGALGYKGYQEGSISSDGFKWRTGGGATASVQMNLLGLVRNFLGSKTAAFAEKASEWVAPAVQTASGAADKVAASKKMDDLIGKDLLEEDLKKLDFSQYRRSGDFSLGAAGAIATILAEQTGMGDYVNYDTDRIFESEIYSKVVQGTEGNSAADDLRMLLAGMGGPVQRQILNGNVRKAWANQSMGLFRAEGYESETIQEVLQEATGASVEETKEKLGDINIGPVEGQRGGKRAAGAEPGVTRMPNEITRAVADYGDGYAQSLDEGSNELNHVYDRAGYYLTTITVEHEALSGPPQGFVTQVQDMDPGNEGFPSVVKAGVVALAQATGVGGITMGSDAWGTFNGDRVPLALKTAAQLNPVDWNTSGDGIDDHWQLRMGLDPRKDNADEDPDGDGLTNWQEYQAERPGEGVAPQARRTLRGVGQANVESMDATHPLKKDSDGGGIADGDEELWGTNPKDPTDDEKPCSGCLHDNGTAHCLCAERLGHHCECGGCEECMPEKKGGGPNGSSSAGNTGKSHDPNEMSGPLGAGEERLVEGGEWLEYTVYFENQEGAEASAQEIWVSMQLDEGVDWSTFEAGSVQVGATWDEGLAGKANWTSEVAMAEGTFRVRSRVRYDAETGKVEWYLRVVDPAGYAGWPDDPYAGMLPPNDPETHCGEGALTYRVRVTEDAEAGTVVGATATITFDYNEPIVTDPSWWNTVAEELYEVTFVDEDGRVLKEAAKYLPGTAAGDIVQPETPSKAADEQYTYEFAGWSPALEDVTEDATYTATYTESLRSYTVRFEWHGGESEATYEYGTAAGAVAVPDNPPNYSEDGTVYWFVGWVPAVAEVTEDATYAAQYAEGAAIARIVGGDVYPSLSQAIAAAESGATVVLLADDEVSFAEGGVVIDKNLVIDGAGFTVRGVSNANIHNVTANATPPDVEFDGVDGSNVRGFFVKAGNVTFTNLVLTEFGDTDYVNKFGYTPIQTASAYDGTLTIADVDIDKFNRTAICIRGGTFLISGGTITANAENRDVLAQGKDHFQQPIEIRGGTGTIEGVAVSGGDLYGSNGGGAIVAWSGVTVSNVSIDFTGVGIWADYANITVTGGETSVAATDKALFVEDGGSIAVAVGDFAGALAVDAVEGSAIVVNGGTFDAQVPAEFAGAGLAATTVADGSGKYTVRTARTATFDSNGGSAVVPAVVADGEPVAEPDPAPLKEHYSLRAWLLGEADYDFAAAVTADITLVADWVLDRHTVAFVDEDGTPISSAQYDYGTAAADIERPENPAKADGSTVYEFSGWQPEIVAVTEDATYWATYRLLGVAAANGVVVPTAWLETNCPAALGEDGAAALEEMAANRIDTVWQCYVAGLDPNDAGSRYECEAEMEMGEVDEVTGAAEVLEVAIRVTVPAGRVAEVKRTAALETPFEWIPAAAFTNRTDETRTETYRDEGGYEGGTRFYRVLLKMAE